MLKKKCSSCDRKIDRGFRFCPWCGKPTKKVRQEDYGMLGLDDNNLQGNVQNSFSLFGGSLGNILNQVTKQLSKELQNLDLDDLSKSKNPRGVEIRFSTGKPIQKVVKKSQEVNVFDEEISDAEIQRRKKLSVEIAESKVRRLPEGIIYELDTPGVRSKQDVSIIRMENSLEIRVYTKDKCYIKTIPIKVDVLKYGVKDGKVLVQIKN